MAVGCFETGIVFSSTDTGWLTWGCSSGNGEPPAQRSGPVVASTRDGGRTWTPVALPSYPTDVASICDATPPTFIGNRGVLQVNCAGIISGKNYVYTSADTGEHGRPSNFRFHSWDRLIS